jgi:hypothetical protein
MESYFPVGLLIISLQAIAPAPGAENPLPETPLRDADRHHEEERSERFLNGRAVPEKSSAELRHRAYETRMWARAAPRARCHVAQTASQAEPSSEDVRLQVQGHSLPTPRVPAFRIIHKVPACNRLCCRYQPIQ